MPGNVVSRCFKFMKTMKLLKNIICSFVSIKMKNTCKIFWPMYGLHQYWHQAPIQHQKLRASETQQFRDLEI